MTKRAHNHKLSEADRAEIDEMLAYRDYLKREMAEVTLVAIARKKGVHVSAIKQYKQGDTYKK